MKKLFLILMMTGLTMTAMAQSQLSTVRGKTKDGKNIKVQYYKGTVEDVIQSVSYDLVDELQNKTKKLQSDLDAAKKEIKSLQASGGGESSELKNLRKKVKDYEKEVANLNKQIKELKKQIPGGDEVPSDSNDEALADLQKQVADKDKTIGELNTVLDACNVKLKDMEQVINELKGVTLPPASPVIGATFGLGPALIGKSTPDYWAKDVNWALLFEAYYGTGNLTGDFPLSVEAGLGLRNFKMSASLAEYTATFNTTDNDGDNFEAHYRYTDLEESLKLTYLDIPVRICISQPLKDRVTVYVKAGLTPSLKIGSKFNGTGTYELYGYYPQWDVTIENVDVLGFGEKMECYKDYTPEVKSFMLWGNLALGAYVPFKDTPIELNAGVKFDFPLTKVGAAPNGDFIPGTTAAVLSNGGKATLMSLQLGIVYNLK